MFEDLLNKEPVIINRIDYISYMYDKPLFPVWGNKKNPVSLHGYKDATLGNNIFDFPMHGYNTGYALPYDNKVVVDVDENKEKGYCGLESLEKLIEECGPLPRTLTQRTPHGGLHFFFDKEGVGDKPVGKLAPDIDFKVEGYVLIYPSKIDGNQYEIIDMGSDEGIYIAKLPQKWLDKVNRTDSITRIIRKKPTKRIYKNIDINKVFGGCKFLQYCRDNADTLSEPMWFSMVSILASIEDSDGLIHDLSYPYPKYKKSETQKKIENARKFGYPHSCRYISSNYPDVCTGCDHIQ